MLKHIPKNNMNDTNVRGSDGSVECRKFFTIAVNNKRIALLQSFGW